MSTKFTISVDPLKDVLDIKKGQLMTELTPYEVTPGQKYEVFLKSNAKYAGESLPVNKVVVYNTTNNNPNGWFYVIEEGKSQVITIGKEGTEHDKIYAFFIDIHSEDNTGSSALSFTPVF